MTYGFVRTRFNSGYFGKEIPLEKILERLEGYEWKKITKEEDSRITGENEFRILVEDDRGYTFKDLNNGFFELTAIDSLY